MVTFSPPRSPRRGAKEVDSLSLDGDDMEDIKIALQSVFEAAVELDTFLADEENKSDDNNGPSDDDSFASEERRIHESEVYLRRTLATIDPIDDETDSVDACLSCEPLDAFCAESYESPESQVPSLQPVSPFGSPFSESSTISMPSKGHSASPVLEVSTVTRIHSPPSKRRQIRAYGLRPQVEGSFVDLEASLEQPLTPKGDGSAQVVANALFGRTEYSIRPFFSDEEYKRTVQGTVSVVLASGIVIADCTKNSPYFVLLIVLAPILIAMIQAKLPHQTDETILAITILGTHVALSHLSSLSAF